MGKEQTALSFNLGITNVPGDATCDDNALEECVGMVFEDGEHRVVQRPVEVLSGVEGTLLYVHKLGDDRRYILYRTVRELDEGGEAERATKRLSWSEEDGIGGLSSSYEDILPDMGEATVRQVTSIGKTLIVSTTDGMRYFLWKDDAYIVLSDDIPMPDIEFRLTDWSMSWWDNEEQHPEYQGVTMHMDTNGTISNDLLVHANQQSSWNNIVAGLYARNKKMASDNGRFVNPFFVRAAVKMYDGTYAKMTAPVLMVPSMRNNSHGEWHRYAGDWGDHLWLHTYSCRLQYKLLTDYSGDYQDLVDGVDIFVTDEIETMNVGGDVPNMKTLIGDSFPAGYFQNQDLVATLPGNDDFDRIAYSKTEEWIAVNESPDGSISDDNGGYNDVSHDLKITSINAKINPLDDNPDGVITRKERVFTTLWKATGTGDRVMYGFIKMPLSRSDTDIKRDIEEASVFYKLAEAGRSASVFWLSVDAVMRKNTLTNITTQPQLADEYFGHSRIRGDYAYVYNSRLNLSDVTRTLFNGFTRFMPYRRPFSYHYAAYVTIASESGSVTVKQWYTTAEKQGIWFFYPDARAKHVQIWRKVDVDATPECVLDTDLKEHKGLNGAYYFRGLPADEDYEEAVLERTLPTGYGDGPVTVSERLTNMILVSEVDNPFVFKSEGYVQVGIGRVKAMSTITQAVSQGQFGGFPLIAFSDNGVWALSVANTGIISGVAPKERDVISSAQSVTQSDDAVFFVSDRGLMAVTGTGNGVSVQCVSGQLTGRDPMAKQPGGVFRKTFAEFLKDAVIAYDYRDGLLWIGRDGCDLLWLYNIKSGTFSHFKLDATPSGLRFVNDYPDYLMQTGSTVYSFVRRPDCNRDDGEYSGSIVTRPMKFSNALALKSIRQIRNVSDMEGRLRYRLFASNDLKNWVELISLRGMAWKYFKMRFDFSGMSATDRFAGTVVVTQERLGDKLR